MSKADCRIKERARLTSSERTRDGDCKNFIQNLPDQFSLPFCILLLFFIILILFFHTFSNLEICLFIQKNMFCYEVLNLSPSG